MKTSLKLDADRLLKRMERYEEVTGKQVAQTLRRQARLLAVSVAYSTPPYGSNLASRRLGERAVQNDILRVFTPVKGMELLYPTKQKPFRDQVAQYFTRDPKLRDRMLKAIDSGDSVALQAILTNIPAFKKLHVSDAVDGSIHKKTRDAYGRVRKGWKSRELVMDTQQLEAYIKERQARVGLTKAAWAAAALKVKADVQNAFRGIPAWVKRHAEKAPASVEDRAEGGLSEIRMTSKIPWADKALRPNDYKEAMRIGREKFYRAMGKEIRMALKKEAVV